MGGGVCWLDYDNDGWMDLFVVNSYGEGDIGALLEARRPAAQRPLPERPRAAFTKVYGRRRRRRGEGCVAADLNGDGRTDLYVTTAQSDQLLWNDGDGTFTEGARAAGVVSFGWHSGAAVGGRERRRPARPLRRRLHREPRARSRARRRATRRTTSASATSSSSTSGNGRFREVGRQVGLDPKPYDHSLGAVFTDLNERRPPRPLRRERRGPEPRLPERAGRPARVPLRRAGADARPRRPERRHGRRRRRPQLRATRRTDLFVTNSRGQEHAVYRQLRGRGLRARPTRRRPFADAFGTNFTGWGDSLRRPRTTTARSTSCSRTATSRSRTWRRTPAGSR